MKQKLGVITALLIIIIVGIGWLTWPPSPLFKPEYSTVVLDEEGLILRVFLNQQEQWALPPVDDKIPPKLKEAVLAFEDKRFYHHPGIDPLALVRALFQNIKNMKKISGASTITMQVARLSDPKARSLKNKVLEMFQALEIELCYSKEEILKLYLDHAPYGGNIIGYRTAAYRYYGKKPEEITWAEAATLAILPNSPSLINPLVNSDELKSKRNRLLYRLTQKGVIDQETYQLAIKEKVPDEQIPFDLAAPHLAQDLKSSLGQYTIKTTISRNLQMKVKQLADYYMEEMKERGANNCSVLLVSTRTGEVKAYLGSNDFFDQENSGQVNGVKMARSTGSILKPFLYALALEEGMLIPESKIRDIPINYGAYTPYNYDGKFAGIVTVREALVRSLNAPAVSVLDQYGIERFYSFLKKAGLTTLFRSPTEYGLPLILGGAEASLWDVATLYYGLSNYGLFSPLQIVQNPKKEKQFQLGEELKKNRQLISAGSAYLVLDILKDLSRPGLDYFWQDFVTSQNLSWKTGTSYGNRDSWAVGVSPDWTIAVWVGNFDGSESKVLTGLGAAAPLLFKIFNSLDQDYYQDWFVRPADLKKIMVSTQTGYPLPGQLGEVSEVDAPASALPLRFSPYEQIVYLNQAGTEEVCSLCWQPGDVKEVLKVIYPPEVVDYLKSSGNALYTIPPHRKSCPSVTTRNPIKFIYPQNGSVILIPRGIDGKYQKVKVVVADSRAKSRIFWYLDDNYLGETTNKHQLALLLQSGQHKLHVVDAEGHFQEIEFTVERKE